MKPGWTCPTATSTRRACGRWGGRAADHHHHRHPAGARPQAGRAAGPRQPDPGLVVQQDPAGPRRAGVRLGELHPGQRLHRGPGARGRPVRGPPLNGVLIVAKTGCLFFFFRVRAARLRLRIIAVKGLLAGRRGRSLTEHCGTGSVLLAPGGTGPRFAAGNGGRGMTRIHSSRIRRPRGMAAAAAFVAVLGDRRAGHGQPIPGPRRLSPRRLSLAQPRLTRPRPGQAPPPSSCPWLNQSLPVSQRVRMDGQDDAGQQDHHGRGPGTNQPYVFYISAIPSLCIPAMGQEDGPNGVGDGLTGVTQLPAAVRSRPPSTRRWPARTGRSSARRSAARAPVNLGPTVNIDRDPRWGRSFESFTEDPYLNAALAVGEIDGVQSTGRDVPGQALRRVQPGDQPQHHRRRRDRELAGGARDLPARVPGRGDAGPRRLGDVRLQLINGQFACQNRTC